MVTFIYKFPFDWFVPDTLSSSNMLMYETSMTKYIFIFSHDIPLAHFEFCFSFHFYPGASLGIWELRDMRKCGVWQWPPPLYCYFYGCCRIFFSLHGMTESSFTSETRCICLWFDLSVQNDGYFVVVIAETLTTYFCINCQTERTKVKKITAGNIKYIFIVSGRFLISAAKFHTSEDSPPPCRVVFLDWLKSVVYHTYEEGGIGRPSSKDCKPSWLWT